MGRRIATSILLAGFAAVSLAVPAHACSCRKMSRAAAIEDASSGSTGFCHPALFDQKRIKAFCANE